MSKFERQLLVWLFPHAISYHNYIPGWTRAKKAISVRGHVWHGVAEHMATMALHKDIGHFELFRVTSSVLPYFLAW